MERIERLENKPCTFPHVSGSWMLLEKVLMIFADPRGLFRSVSPFWQFFYCRSLISCSSYKSSQLFNRVQGGSLMQFRTQLSWHYVLERLFFYSRQRNEILFITEHSDEAAASPWLPCNGLWRVIRRGPGHRAGIKCCPLPLAAHGVCENYLGQEQPGQNSPSDGKCLSFLKALGSRRPGRATQAIENPTVNHVYVQHTQKSSISSSEGFAALLVPCFSLGSVRGSSCRAQSSSHPEWPTWGTLLWPPQQLPSRVLRAPCPHSYSQMEARGWQGAENPRFLLPSLSILVNWRTQNVPAHMAAWTQVISSDASRFLSRWGVQQGPAVTKTCISSSNRCFQLFHDQYL